MTTTNEANIVEQKAEYEKRIEEERKRRFAILSGNLKPITTNFNLKQGEHVYFQFYTYRMADQEYIESHTTGITKKKGTIKRAIVGDLLFGKAGAVIGGVTGGSETQSYSTQHRVTRTEIIDTGTMLFTNKRMLFVGEEIVSITYDDILAIDFSHPELEIKYPQMVKGESYTNNSEDVEMYYKGIQRLIGRDKSNIKLEDVEVNWPTFVPPKVKQVGNDKWYKSNLASILLLIFFFPAGVFTMWRYTKWHPAIKLTIMCIAVLFVLLIMISAGSSSTSPQQSQTVAAKPTIPTPTIDDPKITAYKAKVKPIIDQFEAEDALLDADKTKQEYRTDPVYIQADKVYRKLANEFADFDIPSNVPDSYKGYDAFLSWIMSDMADSMDNIVGVDGSSHTNGFSLIGMKTCEEDIKIADKMQTQYGKKSQYDVYNGYDGKIQELQNIATGKL